MSLSWEVFQLFSNLRFLQECLESLVCLERLVVLIYRVGLFPHDHLLAQPAPTDYENGDYIEDIQYLNSILNNQSQCLIMDSRNLL